MNVSLSLIGENASPVTASLSLFHRSGTNVSSSTALPAKLQQDEALYWDVGEYGSPKTVTVTLPQAVSLTLSLALNLILAQVQPCARRCAAVPDHMHEMCCVTLHMFACELGHIRCFALNCVRGHW